MSGIYTDFENQLQAFEPFVISKWFIEIHEEGSVFARKKLELLLDTAHQGDTIYVENLSRIADSIDSLLYYLKIIITNKVGLYCIKEQFNIYSSIDLDNCHNDGILLLIDSFEKLSLKNLNWENSNIYNGFEIDDVPIGVNALLFNKRNQLLLGKRKNVFGNGLFSLIGGKLKIGESIKSCIIRELFEEIGIIVKETDVRIANISFSFVGRPMIVIGTEILQYGGNPYNKEKQQCECLRFFDVSNLPTVFPVTKTNIDLFIQKKFYDYTYNIFD